MSGHTPGPWRFAHDNDSAPGIAHIYAGAETGNDVLEATNVATLYGQGVDSKSATMADARLIAAAPELLEALERLVVACEPMGWGCNEARAAIAKATGAV